jgi:Fur family transcriptional regulator, ferric uptake regulator
MAKRSTSSKQAVQEILKNASSAMSQPMIQEQLDIAINRVTIYRILESFEEDGLIHMTMGGDGIKYYALCHYCSKHHHVHDHFHFQCTSCGQIECLDDKVEVKLPAGYQLASVNAVLTGVCGRC